MNAVGARVRGEFTTYGTTSTYTYVCVHCIRRTYTCIRIRTLVNNTGEIHCSGKLETANVRPQNRPVSTHFESFRLIFLIYPSIFLILCWWYMHAPHYKWNFNLPFESDFVRVVLASLTMNGQTLAYSVIFFASIGSVRWLRPNVARSQRARHVAPHVESR